MLIVAFLAGAITLPGAPPVSMDYLAYDAANERVWVPAGNSGNVDVIDVPSGKLTPISGFPTATPRPSGGHGPTRQGPSSVTIAEKVAWVGNRGDNKVCAFDRKTLAKGECVQLASMPDGVQWVASSGELWITTPRDQTLTIVDGKKQISTIKLEGDPEGYALDGKNGVFYTNLEDKDLTLAVDVKTRKVTPVVSPGCGTAGPRGLVLDGARKLLLVACTDGAVAIDLAHGNKIAGRVKTGGGVDNLDYDPARKLLHVASREAGTLTFVKVADSGELSIAATVPTAKGARNPVVDKRGTVYVPDSPEGKVLVVEPPNTR
jgi:DNA-binding beta-propeller fold protein YncE